MAHPKHESVRLRYDRRCGYCGVSETQTGGELTVDHFRPCSEGGDESDDNLVYCCFRCNAYKGDFYPTPADVRLGLRVLHPILDVALHHFRENRLSGRLEPLSETGRFHIEILRLNRPQLVEQRLVDRLRHLLLAENQALGLENEALRVRIALLQEYLSNLRRLEP